MKRCKFLALLSLLTAPEFAAADLPLVQDFTATAAATTIPELTPELLHTCTKRDDLPSPQEGSTEAVASRARLLRRLELLRHPDRKSVV